MAQTKKCLKNMPHEWVTIEEYDSHIVKRCIGCKTKQWTARATGILMNRNPEPLRTCI